MFRRTLSKSKILAFRQCVKRLWLEVHRPELREDSVQTQTTFQGGYQVGEIARRIYGEETGADLIDVETEGYDAAFARTRELITSGRRPIFEAGFSIPGALAFADVLVPVRKGGRTAWRMVEVKSSASVKNYHRDDLAFQSYLALQAGVPIASVSIAHVDSSWVYPGEEQYLGLLREVDLTDETIKRAAEAESWLRLSHETVALPSEPVVEVGPHCQEPFSCGFCNYCHRDLPETSDPLAVLPNLTAQRRATIEALAITRLDEVPPSLLTGVQQKVQKFTANNEIYFDATGAADELSRHPLAAAFLDFETTSMVVPVWPGTRPYQQVPFQFSMHAILEDGTVTSGGFLDLSGNDPSRNIAERLVALCGDIPTVFAYNASFERRVIQSLSARFPDLAGALDQISGRIVDLLPVARAHYYHPVQAGSWSLKAILPAICPDLSYNELDGVQNGGEAASAFLEAVSPETSPERKEEIRQQLETYCALDTLALLRIWQHFSGRESGSSTRSII